MKSVTGTYFEPQGCMLVFAHIPKTAGTSLNLILRRYFGATLLSARYRKGAVDAAYRAEDLRNDLAVFGQARCVTGHCLKPYVDFGSYSPKMFWFTFLREPEARFLSLYVHQQTRSASIYHMDLRDWAARFRRSNGMVRMLAGEENLEKAQEILLDKFRFVGFVENFDASLQQMKRVFGLSAFDPSLKKRRMVSKGKEIMQAILADYSTYQECIELNNALDRQLYDFARAKMIGWEGDAEQANDEILQGWGSKAWKYLSFEVKDRLVYRNYLRFTGQKRGDK